MFKSWRSDKKKIKVVFQLQFQATQVPKLKKSGVTIALVPEDVGKSTLRLEKVAAQDGICLWENPVYETVKLIRETKTGKLSEKIYHFVVSNGSSKAGFLGEASIDFADFVTEPEPVTVSLPLKFANSGAILHVTIHRIEGGEDQRYIGDGEDLTISREDSLQSQSINYSDNVQHSTVDEQLDDELFLTLRQNSMPQRVADTAMAKKNMHRRTNTDWSGTSTSDGSLVELSNSPEDIPKEWHRGSENPVEKLRSENAMLSRQVEVSELELQSLRKQILKENNRTRDLSRQITSLQEERDAMKMEAENEGSKVMLKEIRQELDHEKDLNANLRLQLQKTEDSNSNLILAVRDLNEMLEQKNMEISHLSSELEASTSIEEARANEQQHDANELHTMKQTITDLNSELEFYKKHKDELEMHIEELSRENDEISSQLKQNQQQESLKTQNESSEYLTTINELESQVQRLEDKIKRQSEEYSETLIAINELESQVKELNKELEDQTLGFEDELNAVIQARTEQEQRAIRAEEALRNTRWKNAVNAERLQEEFKRLSVEMASRFDENETMTTKAVEEANDLEIQKLNLEEMLQKANEELGLLKDQSAIERHEFLYQLDLKEKQIEKMSAELNDKTAQLEYAQKQENEKQEALSKEIQMLKTEIEKLEEQRNQFSAQANENVNQSEETRKVKTSNEKTETLIQRWNKERGELEKEIASAKKETEKAQKQLISTRSLKDKKEMVITNLQSEMENIRVECNDLNHSLVREEREKEKLRKQLSQLKNDLQKKEEEITIRSSHSISTPQESKDITSLQKKMRLLKEQINLKEAALKTPANSTTEKESNLSNMIEELESIMEQLKTGHCFSAADQRQKESTSAGIFSANVNESRDKLHSKMTAAVDTPPSTVAVPFESDAKLAELLCEVEGLKERNKSMECELKDMEERYSEISLKFAEVEGERQQLVMTVRNLKNGKKN